MVLGLRGATRGGALIVSDFKEMDRLPIASGFSAIQNNSDLPQGLSQRLAAQSTTRAVGILMPPWSRRERIKVAGDPRFDWAIRRCAMNMSVTEFVVPPATVGRNRSVWREIMDAVMEGAPRTAADESVKEENHYARARASRGIIRNLKV
jgi:hypothetical protein